MITFRARLLSLKVFRSVPGVIFKLITLADFHGDHGRAKPKIPSKYVARLRHSIKRILNRLAGRTEIRQRGSVERGEKFVETTSSWQLFEKTSEYHKNRRSMNLLPSPKRGSSNEEQQQQQEEQ